VNEARQWMADRLHERFSVVECSQAVAVSPRQLQYHFQQELGHSPLAEAKRMGLQRLRGLLLDRERNSCSVAELMTASGLIASGVTSADYGSRNTPQLSHHSHLTEQEQEQAMSYRAVAQQFGDCIASNNYGGACVLLTKELQSATTPESIKNAVATMTAYASGPIQGAQVMNEFTLEDWPGKQADDLAVAYVALNGENFSEAVTLTLAEYGHEILIRHLEWGRP